MFFGRYVKNPVLQVDSSSIFAKIRKITKEADSKWQ